MSRRFPWLVSCALALALALALVACGKQPAAPEPVRAVKVVKVGASPAHSAREFPAEVRAQLEVRLGFRVGGKIQSRQAQLGQRVRAGQVLAEVEAQDFRLALDAARAQVVAATTNRDLAAAELKRFAALKEQNFISGAELERRETSFKAAQAQLEQAQAQMAAQGNQAAYTRLLAPAAGVVTGIEAEPGQVVAAGVPVVRLAQDGPRDVVFSVPEDRVGAMRAGSEVQVRPWADERVLIGHVREVAASADPVTRTFQVKVGLPAQAQLALGSTVSVAPSALSRKGDPMIKLPTSALRQEGQGTSVWVVEPASMTVRAQGIQVATADGNDAVIASGLQPGMLVVTAGVHVLSPGEKVTLWKAVP